MGQGRRRDRGAPKDSLTLSELLLKHSVRMALELPAGNLLTNKMGRGTLQGQGVEWELGSLPMEESVSARRGAWEDLDGRPARDVPGCTRLSRLVHTQDVRGTSQQPHGALAEGAC